MSEVIDYGFGVDLDSSLDEAVERTRAALQAEGFGVLTTIDVRETMREKLGVEMEPYVILGACNPQLAHRGLQAAPDLGLLLPCNVTVRESGGRSQVMAVDPQKMLGIVGADPELAAVAGEAARRLRRVADSLAAEDAEREPRGGTA
jgi:uncharacterized protein (DUF302 family)